MTYTYKTKGTCSSSITFEINDGIVSNVSFTGGCNGNLKAISKLVDGMGGYVFSPLHGIVIGLGKAHFEQSIGRNSLFLHGLKQGFIANHNTTSTYNYKIYVWYCISAIKDI